MEMFDLDYVEGRAIVNMSESDIVVLVIKLLVIWAREMASAMFLL